MESYKDITEKELARRKKISQTLTGYKRPPMTEQHRENLRRSHLGQKCDEKCRQLLLSYALGNKVMVGKKHKPETIEKMKGRKPWNTGKRMTHMEGEKNWRWNGGITSEYIKIRTTPECKKWSKDILIRDNFICQKCSKKGGDMHAHHILKFSDFPEYRLNLFNGITLCKKCHLSIKGKEANYEIEFLNIVCPI